MRDLTINLNTASRIPLYEQIYEYIRDEITAGRIPAGEKLPSGRALAAYLEVSRSTVDLAYEQLLSEGYVESIPCKGYYACRIEELYRLEREPEHTGQETEAEQKRWDYDFTPNGIDLDSFPFGVWRRITKDILLDDRKELFQLGDPRGEKELRETICSYLHRARGVNCSPDQILIGAGNDYLQLLLASILGTNHRIAMESPTYRHAYQIFEQLGFSMCTVPMDGQGMRVDSLAESGADIAYVMPSHQYPLGIVMPIKRRLELLRWAAQKPGRYLIEDDYDSEFRYKGKPIPALQGSDAQGRVIYIGTFSKAIAPAIRISYLVLPRQLWKENQRRLSRYSSTVSRIDQMILNDFIKQGHFERHLNRMRKIYSRKHDLLIGALRALEPACRITGEHAGVHFLMEFTNGWSEEELVRRAEQENVRVYPLSAYRIGEVQGDSCPTVILGYATLTEKEITEAAARLLRAWGQELDYGREDL